MVIRPLMVLASRDLLRLSATLISLTDFFPIYPPDNTSTN